MNGYRVILHTLFVVLLPLVVVWFGLSLISTIALVVLGLIWRWMISLSIFIAPVKQPELELETISASHFVEKVRWSMDLLGVDYVERPSGGSLRAFYLGRSVPRLTFRTGAVRSSIGNSREILRYLWGRYEPELGDKAHFLQATAERLEWEEKIDRCGANLQTWVYYHILPDSTLTLKAWGTSNPLIPFWQRFILRVIYPLQSFLISKAFKISSSNHAKAVGHIDALLGEAESRLSEDSQSILGGDHFNYTDIAFAAIMGLWLQPVQYGAGKADSVRIEPEETPKQMREDIERWKTTYPLTTAFIARLYREHRVAN